jgi:CRP/FNR family transcriptional regulator
MASSTKWKCLSACIDNEVDSGCLWSALTEKEADHLNCKTICREYTPGETVFMEGNPCKGLYFIKSGLVGVRKIDVDGQSTLLRLASRGDTLGYRPFLAKQPHRACAEVIEDARICFIDARTIRTILQNNHELGTEFLKCTARALGEAEEQLFKMAVLNVDTRVIHLLVLFHDRWGSHLDDGSVNIRLPITRDDMASMIGAHPDSVSRAIRQLESKGLMQVDGRSFRIKEFNLLAEQLHTDIASYH